MSDAKWVSYFRRAVLLTMALPECGSASGPAPSSEGVSTPPQVGPLYDDSGTVPSAEETDGSPSVSVVPSGDAGMAALDSSAEGASIPAPQPDAAPADAQCGWVQTPFMGCNWSRDFTGDPITCAGFIGSARQQSCFAPCGKLAPMLTILTCDVQVAADGGGGTVTCNGSCTLGNGGRRPLYFASLGFGAAAPGREIGTHFARAACMEAGSVEAFRWLRDELVAHGAPKRLVRAASRAIRDEIRHVRQTSALARRFGEEPVAPPPSPPRIVRPLSEMAVANAIEGCVRETYSTLECLWQGRLAQDPVVRATMQRIARDELRHLALSWTVHGWAMRRLGREARARVHDALRDEITTLKGELRSDPHESLVRAGGLPRALQSQALIDAIAAKIAA